MRGEVINADRSLAQVTQGIRVLSAQTVANMCQLGKLLTEAKAMVGHGGWGKYLEDEISYSHSTANYFMRMFEEYGEYGPNSQTIGNLGGTKALALLSLPADQREQFAEEHKDDSVRQFKAEIARLTKRAEQAEAKVTQAAELMALATEENGALKQRLDGIDADYKAQLDTVDRENDELRANLQVARDNNGALASRAGKAEADAENLRRELEEARAKPAKISPAQAEALRQEGADAAMNAQRELITAAQAKATDVAAAKDREIAELKAMLEKAQKAAPSAAANPNYGAFKASFEALVPAFQQVCTYAIAAADTEDQVTANRNALKGLLLKLGQFAEREVTAAKLAER